MNERPKAKPAKAKVDNEDIELDEQAGTGEFIDGPQEVE